MAVVAAHRCHVEPAGTWSISAGVMTGNRADVGRRVEARLALDEGLVEEDVHAPVAMEPADHARWRRGARHGMARRARVAAQSVGRGFDVRGVGTRGLGIARKEAEIARGIIARSIAMAGAAGENPAGLVVAARARRSPGCSQGDARRPRERSVVARAACVRVQRVEHLCPALASQKRPVESAASRIDDSGVVHRPLKCGGPSLHPCRQRRRIGGIEIAAMGRCLQHRKNGGETARRERSWYPRGRHTADGPQKRRCAPSGGGCRSTVTARAMRREDRGDALVENGRGGKRAVGRAPTAPCEDRYDRPPPVHRRDCHLLRADRKADGGLVRQRED